SRVGCRTYRSDDAVRPEVGARSVGGAAARLDLPALAVPGLDRVAVTVAVGGVQFLRRQPLHAVAEVELRRLAADLPERTTGLGHTVLVDGGLDRDRLSPVVGRELVRLLRRQRLVHLDELPAREPHDDAGLATVQRL